jgi:histidinol-phosphate aminotransferase
MDRGRLERLIAAAADALVVIDEAYIDYAPRDQLELYRRHSNVAILRTLSKVGFASLRIGWLLATPDLVTELDKARLPYNLNVPAQRLGALALEELSAEIDRITEFVVGERQRMTKELAGYARVRLHPSDANFLWLTTERSAEEVFAQLAERSLLVRSFHQSGGRLAHQLRVTVGTREENDAILQALREVT